MIFFPLNLADIKLVNTLIDEIRNNDFDFNVSISIELVRIGSAVLYLFVILSANNK